MPRKAPCKYFSVCGGCTSQTLTYAEQIKQKEEFLEVIFGRKVKVHGAKEEFSYRGKMDFSVQQNKLCLHTKKRDERFVAIDKCLLCRPKTNALLEEINGIVQKFSWYDYATHTGFIRHVSIRESSFGEVMIIFTTTSSKEDGFLEEVQKLRANSTYWFVFDGKSDDAICGEVETVIGKTHISEELLGTRFLIGPRTFFQSNKDVSERIFSRIRDEVKGRVLDVCCGVGAISLVCAQKAKEVLGVEINKESIELAEKNASLNGINNVKFTCADADSFLRKMLIAEEHFDTVIVDPPRAGLDTAASKISELNCNRIIYMSCNPRTLRKDMTSFSSKYDLVFLEGYDMFSQTEHVECLAIFEKKK